MAKVPVRTYQVGVPGGQVAPLTNVVEAGIVGKQIADSTSQISNTVAETLITHETIQQHLARLEQEQKLQYLQANATLDVQQAAEDALASQDPAAVEQAYKSSLDGLRQKWQADAGGDPGLARQLDGRMALVARAKALDVQSAATKLRAQTAAGRLGNTLDALTRAGGMTRSEAERDNIVGQADAAIAAAVRGGVIRADQADAQKQQFLATLDETTARRLILVNPTSAAAEIASGRFRNIDPIKREALIAHAVNESEAAQRAAQVDADRALTLAKRQQQATSDAAENKIIGDVFGQNPQVTAQQVSANPDLTPDAKLRMISVINRADKPDPLAKTSQQTTMHMLNDMRRPEGDPQRVTDMGPVYDAYIAGNLSRADFSFLRDELTQRQSSPDGQRFSERVDDLLRVAKAQIDPASPMFGSLDQTGMSAQNMYAFEYNLREKIDRYRKEGKDPGVLLDPTSPDYAARPEMVAPFRMTMDQRIRNITEQMRQQSATPPPIPAFSGPDDPGYKALPSGAKFQSPDGRIRTKP